MKITRATEYGIRCVFFLSGQERGAVVGRLQIAREMEIPEQFLVKIAQNLHRAGILEIVQGAKGGFRLIADPEKLNLLDVIEAVTGEIFFNDCLMQSHRCFRDASCAIHEIWVEARESFRCIMKTATFKSLIERESCVKAGSKITETCFQDNLKEEKI